MSQIEKEKHRPHEAKFSKVRLKIGTDAQCGFKVQRIAAHFLEMRRFFQPRMLFGAL